MPIKKFICLTIVLATLLVSGCWDHIDVDEISIVAGIGVDLVPGKEPILLSIQIVNPNSENNGMGGSGGSEKPFLVQSITGKTISDAISKFTKISPRRLLFSHNKVIIFGKSFAEANVKDIVDYLTRDREIRYTNWILIAGDTAKNILETKLDLVKIPARGLETMLNNSKNSDFTYPVSENEFLFRLNNIAMTSFAPLIELENRITETKQKDESSDSSSGGGEAASKQIVLGNKTAIFRDNKMIGMLNQSESKGLFWLINNIKGDTVTIPPEGTIEDKEISATVYSGNTKVIPRIDGEDISVKVICKGEALLREADNVEMDLRDLEKFKQIKKELDKAVKNRIEETINRAQKDLGADFIGFATQIHNNYPYEWKRIKNNWDQIFPNLKYEINVDINIAKSGLIKDTEQESKRKGLRK